MNISEKGILTISKGAWHLKTVRLLFQDYVPRDLCRYFWMVILSCLWLPMMAIFGLPFIWAGWLVNRTLEIEMF